MVPSKSVKKMILGCASRVSGNGIANEGPELGAEVTEGKLIGKRKKERERERKDRINV
jgi:hypothetical protein